MAEVGEDLEAFTAELFDGFFRADQRRWGQVYAPGLLLDGSRWRPGWVQTATGRRWRTS
nr:transposase [Streptomyces sp. TP-A0356]